MSKQLSYLHKNQEAFTLIEVLVALLITTISALSMAYASGTNVRLNTLSEKRTEAVMAVQQVLDDIRSYDITTLPKKGFEIEHVTISDRIFNVKVSYCKDTRYCTSNDIRAINCVATLANENQVLYEVDTVFAQLR